MRTARHALALLAIVATTGGCLGRAVRYDGWAAPRATLAPEAAGQPEYVAPLPDIEARLVAFIRWRNRRLDHEDARHMAVSLLSAAATHRVDERLLACLVAVESSFDAKARSKSGAAGLGQLMPGTARALGVADPHDIDQNLRGTATYLGRMLAAWDGRRDLALASYLQGQGAVRKQVTDGKELTGAQTLFVQRVLGLYDRI